MELRFEFGKEFELNRIKRTLERLEWYESNSYRPKLPAGITKESSDNEIKEKIEEEFDSKKYREIKTKFTLQFLDIKESLENKLKKIFNKEMPSEFKIYLTNYGVGGSYNLPNIIIYNINSNKGLRTIIHEIIHLIIQEWIDKYSVKHWEKERVVDLILNSGEFGFLEDLSWQKDYHGTEMYIDNLFEKYFFKDPEEFFSKIESVSL